MSVPTQGSPGNSSCSFCGRTVEAGDVDTFREVISWVHGPKLDSPVLRTQTGQLACRTCIDRLKEGQAPDQETISYD